MTEFEQELLIVILTAIVSGGGSATLAFNKFGGEVQRREDRRTMIEGPIADLLDQVERSIARVAPTVEQGREGTPPALDLERSVTAFMNEVRWLVGRTTWRDRRAYRRAARRLPLLRVQILSAASLADQLEALRQTRQTTMIFLRYLNRTYDPKWIRIGRWFRDLKRQQTVDLLTPGEYTKRRSSATSERS